MKKKLSKEELNNKIERIEKILEKSELNEIERFGSGFLGGMLGGLFHSLVLNSLLSGAVRWLVLIGISFTFSFVGMFVGRQIKRLIHHIMERKMQKLIAEREYMEFEKVHGNELEELVDKLQTYQKMGIVDIEHTKANIKKSRIDLKASKRIVEKIGGTDDDMLGLITELGSFVHRAEIAEAKNDVKAKQACWNIQERILQKLIKKKAKEAQNSVAESSKPEEIVIGNKPEDMTIEDIFDIK